MKNIIVLIFLLLMSAMVCAQDNYQKQLSRFMKEVDGFGMNIGVFSSNPFQTGTALNGYYLSQKTLLLERDAFFKTKANKLKTTENVADFQHRNRILRIHANNLLVQLSKAIRQNTNDDLLVGEPARHKKTLEQIIEECSKNSACVADKLNNPETSLYNILLDNFGLAKNVFENMPYLHSIEALAVYQLTQLIYLEVLKGQGKLSQVEFDLFIKKQKKLFERLEKNPYLTTTERKLQRLTIKKRVQKWKNRILVRKFKNTKEFSDKANKLKSENGVLQKELSKLRKDNSVVFGDLYTNKKYCRKTAGFRKRGWCKANRRVEELFVQAGKGENVFLGKEEEELPKKFWKEI